MRERERERERRGRERQGERGREKELHLTRIRLFFYVSEKIHKFIYCSAPLYYSQPFHKIQKFKNKA